VESQNSSQNNGGNPKPEGKKATAGAVVALEVHLARFEDNKATEKKESAADPAI
jgi:hypothetical protein